MSDQARSKLSPTRFFIRSLGSLTRQQKTLLQMTSDASILVICLYLAMLLRTESFTYDLNTPLLLATSTAATITILGFHRLGLYKLRVRHLISRSLLRAPAAVAVGAASLYFWQDLDGSQLIPRSVPIIYTVLASVCVWVIRFAVRGLLVDTGSAASTQKNIIVYGAGATGAELAQTLNRQDGSRVVRFVDDNQALRGIKVADIQVHSPSEIDMLVAQYDVGQIIIAAPSATTSQRAQMIRKALAGNAPVKSIPRYEELISGRSTLGQVHDIKPEELLGREAVEPDAKLMAATVTNQTLLVTGAGGSIGSELCRQALKYSPEKIILFDNSEHNLYQIERELAAIGGANCSIVPILGSVCERSDVARVLQEHNIDAVIHAAAYKHVPLVEQNIIKAYENNCIGTKILAEQCVKSKVSSFTLVSTDKAVRPTNIMGATKRICELVCQELDARQEDTKFTIVRFGNVLGSSGSVIPLFKEQIARGGPLSVTHPDITRYFMTTNEAAQLILQAGALENQSRVFILDMGEPVKITDLAANMIRLTGSTPVFSREETAQKKGDTISIEFTGLRPGEKLYEELTISDELRPTAHPKIKQEVFKECSIGSVDALAGIPQVDAALICDLLVNYAELRSSSKPEINKALSA